VLPGVCLNIQDLVALAVDELHNQFGTASSEHFKRCYVTLVASVIVDVKENWSDFKSRLRKCINGDFVLSCLMPESSPIDTITAFSSGTNPIEVDSCNCLDHQICPYCDEQCSRLRRTNVSGSANGAILYGVNDEELFLIKLTVRLLRELTTGRLKNIYPVAICFLLSPVLLGFAFGEVQCGRDNSGLSGTLKLVKAILIDKATDNDGNIQFDSIQHLFRIEAASLLKYDVIFYEQYKQYKDNGSEPKVLCAVCKLMKKLVGVAYQHHSIWNIKIDCNNCSFNVK